MQIRSGAPTNPQDPVVAVFTPACVNGQLQAFPPSQATAGTQVAFAGIQGTAVCQARFYRQRFSGGANPALDLVQDWSNSLVFQWNTTGAAPATT